MPRDNTLLGADTRKPEISLWRLTIDRARNALLAWWLAYAPMSALAFFFAVGLLVPLLSHGQAQPPACKVSPYQGATSPGGAVATVEMANRGLPCVLPNYGLPAERANPASAGRIVRAARNGTASFVAPNASYLPRPGFIGEDEFQYEAVAAGASGRQIGLLVTVKVKVSAPN